MGTAPAGQWLSVGRQAEQAGVRRPSVLVVGPGGVVIGPSAVVIGPSMLGPNTSMLGHTSMLGPNTPTAARFDDRVTVHGEHSS